MRRLRAPTGLPPGFGDSPGLKRECSGGGGVGICLLLWLSEGKLRFSGVLRHMCFQCSVPTALTGVSVFAMTPAMRGHCSLTTQTSSSRQITTSLVPQRMVWNR